MTTRAVVLAGGLGTRMREPDPGVSLSRAQHEAADAGLKAMMPVNGRPFLDYVLGSLVEAGLPDVALVVAPDHDAIRRHLAAAAPARLAISLVVQEAPLGTAHAVLAAEAWSSGESFLVMNGDNLYPVPALRALAALDEPGFPAFEAEDLVRTGNIPAERLRAFALATVDEDGYLVSILEKPGDFARERADLPPEATDVPPEGADLPPEGGSHEARAEIQPEGADLPPEGGSHESRAEIQPRVASAFRRKIGYVSMNCWRFDARIFAACRAVPKSRRGEYELPEAVSLALTQGMRVKAVPARGPVLDLSRRADAADVARRLAGTIPCL